MTAKSAVVCLCQEGIWPARAHELASRHSLERIQRAIEYVKLRRGTTRIDNAAAYLVEVLESATDSSLEVALRRNRPRTATTYRTSQPPDPGEITPEQWQRGCELKLAAARQQESPQVILEALGLLVSHHREQGDLDLAIQHQQEAVRLNPAPASVEALGELYHRVGRLDEARRAYTEAARLWAQVPNAAPRTQALRAKLRAFATNG